MFQIQSSDRVLNIVQDEPLLIPRKLGIMVEFDLSGIWEMPELTAWFSNGLTLVPIPEREWVDHICLIPSEVLEAKYLFVYLYLEGRCNGHRLVLSDPCRLGYVSGRIPTWKEEAEVKNRCTSAQRN